jgi:hypothetical protein
MDGSAASARPGAVRLFSAGGEEAPPELAADLLCLLRLPAAALRNLGEVLVPSLAEPIPKEAEEVVEVFCAAYHADDGDLAQAVRGCRFLIREAAQRDLSAGALGEDLDRLCPDDPLAKEVVLAFYETAKEPLRHEMIKATVADHGKLLVGIHWRMDTIQASERGAKLRTTVAMLTLDYREGTETGRVTLQVLPDMMGELKSVCGKVLG